MIFRILLGQHTCRGPSPIGFALLLCKCKCTIFVYVYVNRTQDCKHHYGGSFIFVSLYMIFDSITRLGTTNV